MITMLKRRGFDDLHAHISKQASARICELPYARKVMNVAYLPGEGRFVGDAVNRCTRTGLKPQAGPYPKIERLVDMLFPACEQKAHILDVLAFHVQHPGAKIRHALMIRGGQGTGKSTLFCNIMSLICGPHNHRVVGGQALVTRFNGELVDQQMVVIDEAVLKDGWSAYNDLKPLITEEKVLAEDKGQSRRLQSTPRLVVVLSNVDTPLPIEDSDRRFYVPDFGSVKAEAEFYRDLSENLASEAPAFYAALRARDTSKFNPSAPPPDTEDKASMKADVRPPIERQIAVWMEEQTGLFAADVVVPQKVLQELRAAGLASTEEAVRRALKSLGGESVQQLPPNHRFGRVRCWAIRNVDKWRGAAPAEMLTHMTSAQLTNFTTCATTTPTTAGKLPTFISAKNTELSK